MTAEQLNDIFDVIQRCDWKAAMSVASAALEQASKMEGVTLSCYTAEERIQWFDQTVKAFG